MGLKENLKYFRNEQKLTLEDVAKKIGVRSTTIQRYESGVITNIPQDKIEKLAEVFNVTPSQLIGWDVNSKSDEIDEPKQKSIAAIHFITQYIQFINKAKVKEEGFSLYNQFYVYAKQNLNDINLHSLDKFMSYLLETFPNMSLEVEIEDIIELYREFTDFTEFKLNKISEKNKK